jgi:hypothetical protein
MMAYDLIGFRPQPRYMWAAAETKIRTTIDGAVAKIVSIIVRSGFSAAFDANARLITLNNDFTICVGSARCLSEGGLLRWHVRVDRRATGHLTLIAKMEPSNEQIQAYYLLPTAELARNTVKRLRLTSRVFSKSCRHDSIEGLYQEIANRLGLAGGEKVPLRPPVR